MLRFITLSCVVTMTSGFASVAPTRATSTALRVEESSWESDEFVRSNLDKFLSTKYPDFYKAAFDKNAEVCKVLQDSSSVTVFVPNAKAFADLGDKKREQMSDPRNLEAVEKMAAYHVVPDEAVPVTSLFQEDWTVPKTAKGNPTLSYRGVMSMGGEVAVGRTKSGGFLGLFQEEDDGVMIGPEARIVQSFTVGETSIVHEVDGLVSPYVLWDFFDQLRIPFVG